MLQPLSRRSEGYQVWLTLLLSLNFGILFFDRQAVNFLMPSIQPDLQLTNTQIGLLSSGLSLTWALSGLLVGPLSDKLGSRKPILVITTVLFCACSVLSGLAAGFVLLLASRLLMGAAEGGVMPVSHAMIVSEVKPEWRGTAMGAGQGLFSSILGSTAAPLILIPIALAYGWRTGFYLAAIPGLITAALIWFTLREPPRGMESAGEPPREKVTIRQALANRNVLLCSLIAIMLVSYLVVTWAFMPLFLTQARGLPPETMGYVMAALGISACVCAIVVPFVSDRIGRKPTFIIVSLMGVILPLAALYYQDTGWLVLSILFFFGWALSGIFPLFMATVPAESVDPRLTATLTGIVMGIGEVLGGVLSPSLAGALADLYGLSAVMWMLIALTLGSFVCSLLLVESAPAVRRRKGLAPLTA